MAKDYARKGRPAPRKKQTEQPAPKKNKTLILLTLVLILIGGFIWFLLSIEGTAPEPETQTPAQSQPKKSVKPLPELPKEKWEYVKELENKTIEVDVPEREDKPSRPYQMQCGSFRTMSQAETLKARIAFSGFESIVKRTEGSNGVWFRVVLGPYDSKRQAEADRHKLQSNKINGCQIWFWT